MKKCFILLAVIGCLMISLTTGIFGNAENLIDNFDNLLQQYEQAGALRNDVAYHDDEVIIATADGNDITVTNCENEINRCLSLDLADTREDAINYMVQKNLLKREVDAAGIAATDEEVDALIASQKKLMAEESEVAELFETCFDSLGLTEDEYWKQYYEDYRFSIERGKLRNEMYLSYLENEVKERLAELDISLSPEEFAQLLEKEQKNYSPAVQEGFTDYYNKYQEQLFEKYHVQIVME